MKKTVTDAAILFIAYVAPLALLVISGFVGVKFIASYVSDQLPISGF